LEVCKAYRNYLFGYDTPNGMQFKRLIIEGGELFESTTLPKAAHRSA